MQRPARRTILDCPFDPVDMTQAVELCLEWCRAPRAPHTVITANAFILCMMRRDEELRRACVAGDLNLADGMSVVLTAKLAGIGFPERVPGVDMMARLLEQGSQHGLRAYFLGAKPEVVRALAERCARDFPGLIVAGCRDGYFKPADHEAIVAAIREARPDFLFVGMPSPFKENWCERHRQALDVPVIMGVGGSFDVLAGFVKRAPRLLQSLGLEWSWRLLMEPGKMWKRYLVTNSEYIWRAAGAIWRHRTGRA